MQLKPEEATWFHCFQIAELYLCTMRLSTGIGSSEEKSNTHGIHRAEAPEPHICTKAGRGWITFNKSGPPRNPIRGANNAPQSFAFAQGKKATRLQFSHNQDSSFLAMRDTIAPAPKLASLPVV
jgi:hypothetical protein